MPESLTTPVQPQDLLPLLYPFLRIRHTQQRKESLIATEDIAILAQNGGRIRLSLIGTLIGDTEASYAALDESLRPYNYYALFREHGKEHLVHLVENRPASPAPASPYIPILLLIATLFSVLYTGTTIAIGELSLTDMGLAETVSNNILPNLWRGLPYALSILLILGAHELGHYFTMRRHHTLSSFPYFIPAFGLSPFGTFGAFITLRSPIRNRKILFDMGVSGPLAGMVFAIPILLIGLATSVVMPVTGGVVEGNSLLYALAKVITFGQFLPNGQVDVLVNQLAWAGWTGLFVTALNLIPLGQLDGGHVMYSLFGNWARQMYLPFLAMLGFFTVFVSSAWLVLVVLLFFVGRFYAIPLDAVTPLDSRRQSLAIATLVLFGLIFVPVPLAIPGQNDGLIGMFLVTGCHMAWQLRHKFPRL